MWRYMPYNNLPANLRMVPAISGEQTVYFMHPGEVFEVQEQLQGDDGITYLMHADGWGWLFDRLADGSVMCVREEVSVCVCEFVCVGVCVCVCVCV